MFTGIVTALGRVVETRREGARLRLVIEAPYESLVAGESIAVNGACLTVVEAQDQRFAVDVITTTRGRTRLGEAVTGWEVNLERAVGVGGRLGGHFVQGHVDGLAEVVAVNQVQDTILMDVRVPSDIAEVTIPQGSIALDGVSLTVNARPGPQCIQVALIPHTRRHTTLGRAQVGDRLHVEGDMIGKYVRQLMAARGQAGRQEG